MRDRTHREFSDEHIAKIADTYHNWRSKGKEYEDIKGFCKSTTLAEVQKHNFILLPGTYIGRREQDNDGVPFEVDIKIINQFLKEQTKSERKLNAEISKTLEFCYGDCDWKEINFTSSHILEQLAKKLFHQWFIEFDFPNNKGKPYKKSGGKMIDSEIGEIPNGWSVKGLEEIADFLNGLALQKYPPVSDADILPVIKIRELKAGITEQTDKASKQITPKYIVDDGDVLFSWSGSLEVVLWCYGKGALNQHLFKVTSKKYPKWFYYYWILEHLQFFRSIAEAKATTMGHIQRHHLAEALVAVPDDDFMAFADSKIKPVFEHILLNNSQIQTLSKLRDVLLPKLMKGEIRVKDVESIEQEKA